MLDFPFPCNKEQNHYDLLLMVAKTADDTLHPDD